MRINRVRAAIAGSLAILSAFALTACSTQPVSPKSDEYVCIYGPQEEGRKLIDQKAPGSNKIDVDSKSQVISVPTSNRFYYMVKDDAIRDPGAPTGITVTSSDPQEMNAQIAIRFTFKQDKICDWYNKHGRRNGDANTGDLGFNARGDAGTGWARWLNENFGETMQNVSLKAPFSAYTWEQLNLPKVEDIDKLNAELSKIFTDKLNKYLGGEYFCGVEYDPTKPDVCPPIDVAVNGTILPTNEQLIKNREALQEINSNAALEQQKAKATQASEAAKQALLDAQEETIRKQARNDALLCVELKKAGVSDCVGFILAQKGIAPVQIAK